MRLQLFHLILLHLYRPVHTAKKKKKIIKVLPIIASATALMINLVMQEFKVLKLKLNLKLLIKLGMI
jgi:hypothetical protein